MTAKYRRYRKQQTVIAMTVMGLMTVVMFRGSIVSAGPVTNHSPAGQAPFTRLGIYSTVLGLQNNHQVLELGNAGRDIASSGDVLFRPSSGNPVTVTSQGLRITAHGTAADLYIPGDLCLYNHATSTFDCRHTFPVGSSSTLWQQQSPLLFGSPYRTLEPKVLPATSTIPGITIGSSVARVTTGYGMQIGTNNFGDANALVYNKGSDEAAKFSGNLFFNKIDPSNTALNVSGTVYVNIGGVPNEVWSGANDPAGTGVPGLDADLANGNQVVLESANALNCADSDAHPHVACLCFTIKYTTRYNSVFTGAVIKETLSPTQHHCINLANRF